MIDVNRAIQKAIKINNDKAHYDMLNILNNKTGFLTEIEKARYQQTYKKGGKAMRMVASVPEDVHYFFERVFGKDYYKDPDFFVKKFSEWNVHKEGDSITI